MKGKKIISLFTALCLSGGVVFGAGACKKDENGDIPDKIPSAVNPAESAAAHYVTNSLHDVNVNYDQPVGTYVKNGATEYKIVGTSLIRQM